MIPASHVGVGSGVTFTEGVGVEAVSLSTKYITPMTAPATTPMNIAVKTSIIAIFFITHYLINGDAEMGLINPRYPNPGGLFKSGIPLDPGIKYPEPLSQQSLTLCFFKLHLNNVFDEMSLSLHEIEIR
jgi:hypothetical protein